MQVTIYLDVIFLVNFLADWFILLLTAMILKERICRWRLILGALFGAGMLLPFLLYPALLIGMSGVIIYIGISLGAVRIAFSGTQRQVLKKWLLSTTIMISLGGVMGGFKAVMRISTLTFLKWGIGLLIGVLLVFYLTGYLRRVIQDKNQIYKIRVLHNKKEMIADVFLDTGNLLWDVLYNKPVILINERLIKQCMGEEEIDIIEEYKKRGFLNYEKIINFEGQKKTYFHEIAYQSVGNPSGKLLCIIASEVRIDRENVILKNQPIALGADVLFMGKDYQGLLHNACI